MTIELEMTKTPPSSSEDGRLQPKIIPIMVPRAKVSGYCTVAAISAIWRTSSRCLIENSTPSANIRNATPRFASNVTCPLSATSPGLFGPTTIPANT